MVWPETLAMESPMDSRIPAAAPGAPAEKRLVEDSKHGDHAAFQRLVERYQRKVYTIACGVLRDGDEARDVVQDAFLRAWRGLHGFDGRAEFSTWLHRITMNLCLD